ncbi:patatin family protein [Heterostelium album PN500]|uniref:Patatin family protein n=1 Tax=Heterostelium pallidum (strain ATCC 26659 / Pp 5 / PN500) TaxID=670386 RepID=D3BAX1_HETP5|nr:patatin family protein [Heterostelium album PN500]EFA81708.1 patatin family protein [Heterostelium album PN500]|eukprot:XP_020433825.1 patatin family protein [Heterostelium album PN500]
MKFLISLIVVSTMIAACMAQSTCRTITFSGAGAFGAYQAGVVSGIVSKRAPADVQWLSATGISAGSINAAALAMFNVGDEVAAANFMTEKWLSISPEQVFVNWKGGVVDGLFLHRGIYDDGPLFVFMTNALNTTQFLASNRNMMIGATNLDTGMFDQFYKTDPEIVKAVIASCSIPGVFPPTEKGGYSYCDGGATYMTPVTDSARLCYETGATNVIVDMVTITGADKFRNMSKGDTIELLLRAGEIIVENIGNKDIETLFQAFPNTILNVYRPSQTLPGNALSFTYSAPLIKIGVTDGQNENPAFVLTKHNYKEMLEKMRQ